MKKILLFGFATPFVNETGFYGVLMSENKQKEYCNLKFSIQYVEIRRSKRTLNYQNRRKGIPRLTSPL